MDTLLTQNQFIKMRDQGKFSTKFLGKHSYFLYLELDKSKNKNLEVYIKDEEDYKSPPPAPRYRKNSTINKYLGIDNIPNKYHVNIN
tara:strand:+ start:73 stop:333 length:261 start_codon:yes stop_codon:yes gene_type:complete